MLHLYKGKTTLVGMFTDKIIASRVASNLTDLNHGVLLTAAIIPNIVYTQLNAIPVIRYDGNDNPILTGWDDSEVHVLGGPAHKPKTEVLYDSNDEIGPYDDSSDPEPDDLNPERWVKKPRDGFDPSDFARKIGLLDGKGKGKGRADDEEAEQIIETRLSGYELLKRIGVTNALPIDSFEKDMERAIAESIKTFEEPAVAKPAAAESAAKPAMAKPAAAGGGGGAAADAEPAMTKPAAAESAAAADADLNAGGAAADDPDDDVIKLDYSDMLGWNLPWLKPELE